MHLVTELKNAVNETCGKNGRDGTDGVCVCKQGLDGRNGKDGRDGAAGKDGRSIIGPKGDRGEASQVPGPAGPKGDKGDTVVGPKGDKGERGDITVYGDAELYEAVKMVRAELLRFRAGILGRIEQGLADSQGTSGASRVVRMRLEEIKREIESL